VVVRVVVVGGRVVVVVRCVVGFSFDSFDSSLPGFKKFIHSGYCTSAANKFHRF